MKPLDKLMFSMIALVLVYSFISGCKKEEHSPRYILQEEPVTYLPENDVHIDESLFMFIYARFDSLKGVEKCPDKYNGLITDEKFAYIMDL